jgi:hypothetical protein
MFSRLFRRANPFPDHVAILLTNPRSGSTWLFDAIRCHPAVAMRPTADMFTWLGMNGRRYPRDLSGDSNQTTQVEVRPGEWEGLPTFLLPPVLQANTLPKYALEKCHPHFFKHDVPGFVGKLRELERRSTVRMLYQVRDPQASLISFLRYRERNATWNPHIGEAELPAHMRRIYESLLKSAQAYPGLIINYDDLEADFAGTMTRIFGYLWTDDNSANPALIAAIDQATGREQRSATTFLGQRVTRPDSDKVPYAAMFERHAADIEACHRAYQALLKLKEDQPL